MILTDIDEIVFSLFYIYSPDMSVLKTNKNIIQIFDPKRQQLIFDLNKKLAIYATMKNCVVGLSIIIMMMNHMLQQANIYVRYMMLAPLNSSELIAHFCYIWINNCNLYVICLCP